MEWKGIARLAEAAMVFLAFFMLVTGYGMTAKFMERSMALLFHVGLEKWAFFAVLILYFLVSELGLRSYRVIHSKGGDMETWMLATKEMSLWCIMITVSIMMATGLMSEFAIHKEIDGIFLGLLLIHSMSSFYMYIKHIRKTGPKSLL